MLSRGIMLWRGLARGSSTSEILPPGNFPYFTGYLIVEEIAKVTRRWCDLINPTLKLASGGYRCWGSKCAYSATLLPSVHPRETLTHVQKQMDMRMFTGTLSLVEENQFLSVGEPINKFTGLIHTQLKESINVHTYINNYITHMN